MEWQHQRVSSDKMQERWSEPDYEEIFGGIYQNLFRSPPQTKYAGWWYTNCSVSRSAEKGRRMIKYRGPGDLKVSFLLHEYLWYYIKKIVLWVVWTEGEWYAHFQIQDSLHCTMNAPHYFISATPRLPKVSPVVTIPDICQTPQKHLRAFFLQIPMHLVSGTTLPDFPLTLQFSFSFPSNFSSYTHFL